MQDPRHDEFEALRQRAIEIGNSGKGTDYRELLELLSSEYTIVRKAAASGLTKYLLREPSLAPLCKVQIFSAMSRESGEQTLHYLLRAAEYCVKGFTCIDFDLLHDIARSPVHKDYVRKTASELIARGQIETLNEKARRGHWCTRCKKIVTIEESKAGLEKYGKPYCRHCLEERIHEDASFDFNVEKAKKLRTQDSVAVQSKGEKEIGNWLEKNGIGYSYDERMVIAGGICIRPDFYLPEFDLYIEYWGMNTPEYISNMQKKRVLYQREHKRLISLYPKDIINLDVILKQKLSRYIRI